MAGVFSLVGNVGTILSHVSDLQHMTKWQWMTLAGFALGGAATAAAVKPDDYVWIAGGALAGVVSHLSGLLQTSPLDKAAAKAAADQAATQSATKPVAVKPSKDNVFGIRR
jgi:hypothetical protein